MGPDGNSLRDLLKDFLMRYLFNRANSRELFRQSGRSALRFCAGRSLPTFQIGRPTKFDLIIDLTAARAARSRDPAHPLARPDEVISRRSGLLRCLSPVGTNLPIRDVGYPVDYGAKRTRATCRRACLTLAA